MSQICSKCGKKVNMFTGFKCKDGNFCNDCVSSLSPFILGNLTYFAKAEILDLLCLKERDDDLVKDDTLEKLLGKKIYWEKEVNQSKKDWDENENYRKTETEKELREKERDLKELERDYAKLKKECKGRLSERQISVHNYAKQEIIKTTDENIADIESVYQANKADLTELYDEAKSGIKEATNNFNDILTFIANRAQELRGIEKQVKDDAEAAIQGELEDIKKKAQEKALTEAREKAKIEAERLAQKEAEECIRREKEERAQIELERKKAQQEIERRAHEEAKEKLKGELEEIRVEAERKALDEAREKAMRHEKEKIAKDLQREERKKNPTHLAIISLVCSILSWVTVMTVLPPFILAVIGLITGIKALKSSRRKMAIAGIIVSAALIIFIAVIGFLVALE